MKIDPTPDQLHQWLAALGAAESVLADIVEKPEQLVGGESTPKLLLDVFKGYSEDLKDLREALIASFNREAK